MHHDPYWPRAGEWIRSGAGGQIEFTGCPLAKSISPGKTDLGPAAIRAALMFYSPFDSEHETGLDRLDVSDQGDVSAEGLSDVWQTTVPKKRILLGGDNGVTYYGVLAADLPLDRIGVITLDAHYDVRHLENGLHNGNPIRALIEKGLPGSNIAQVGILPFANSSEYSNYSVDHGILQIQRKDTTEESFSEALETIAEHTDAIYLDLDLDVMDRAFAPGCPGSRPGGLTPGLVQEIAFIAGAHPQVKWMDLVELDPTRDIQERTAMAAASFALSFISGFASTQ